MKRLAAILTMIALLILPGTTLGHGHEEVGDLTVVIGMIGEPVVVGQKSGVEVSLKRGEIPVEGATLTAEVSIGELRESFELEPAWNRPGWYKVDFIPTVPGAYTIVLTGDAEGTAIDLEMTAGPETFSEVAAAGDVSFPLPLPDPSVTATLARQADDRAAFALLLGGVAIALGLAGALRRRS
jgi:hypothetical protein